MADFEYYKRMYHGNEIKTEEEFQHCALFASRLIQNRVSELSTIDENAVNDCICAVAELVNRKNKAATNASVKSETVGGWSRTYGDYETADKSFMKDFYAYIKLFLGVDLKYEGAGRYAY